MDGAFLAALEAALFPVLKGVVATALAGAQHAVGQHLKDGQVKSEMLRLLGEAQALLDSHQPSA